MLGHGLRVTPGGRENRGEDLAEPSEDAAALSTTALVDILQRRGEEGEEVLHEEERVLAQRVEHRGGKAKKRGQETPVGVGREKRPAAIPQRFNQRQRQHRLQRRGNRGTRGTRTPIGTSDGTSNGTSNRIPCGTSCGGRNGGLAQSPPKVETVETVEWWAR